MSNSANAPPAPGYRDRRTGLISFGVLLIAIGGVCALVVLLLLAGPPATSPAAPAIADDRAQAPAAVAYAALAAMFVWLGAGSALTRRWAPPLILTVAWLWLISGVFVVAGSVLILPAAFDLVEAQSGPMPEAIRTAATVAILAFSSVLMLIVPAVLIAFYRSPHVRATCAARDPVPRWTDDRPLSLLGLSLSLVLLALSLLPAMLLYNGLAPCFGVLLTGAPGVLVNLALMATWGYCAWSTCRLDLRGWWATALSFTAATASVAVTFARVDAIDFYRAAGLPADQMQVAAAIGVWPLIGASLACWLSLIGYLLYVRKLFHARG